MALNNCNGSGRYHFACIIPYPSGRDGWFRPFMACYVDGVLVPWDDNGLTDYEKTLDEVTHMIPINQLTPDQIGNLVLNEGDFPTPLSLKP